MKKGTIIYIVFIALGILLLFMFESSMPKNIDWQERYKPNGTNPYDLKVFMDQVSQSPSFTSFENIDKNFYEYSNAHEDKWKNGNYLFLYVGPVFELDSIAQEKLYDFVNAGNDVFISSNELTSRTFSKFKKRIDYNYLMEESDNQITLLNHQAAVQVKKQSSVNYFLNNDTVPFYQLGSVSLEFQKVVYPNFIKIPHGKGNLYLHAAPIVFTNYYLLYQDAEKYVTNVLSFSDKKNVLFYNKLHLDFNEVKVGSDGLKYILGNVQLKYAWYLILLSILFFVIFNAKRRQRKVPIIQPLPNNTVGFAKTIANLFYEVKDHHFIINRRIVYFLEHVRNRYYLDTGKLDDEFVNYLTIKSGVNATLCKQLTQWIRTQENKNNNTSTDLINLNKLLEQFKKEELK